MFSIRSAALAIAAALVVPTLHGQQAPGSRSSLRDALEAKFQELHQAGSFPGGTAAVATGGQLVTATDLARWAQLLYGGSVIDASLMDDLIDGVPAKLGPETKYGLGVIIRPTQFGVTYGHSGFMPGYQTDVMYFPELKTSIAVQVNSSAPRSTGRPLRSFITDFAQIAARTR